MKKVIDRASSRGYFNHGWLKTHHTFSFANYYNPERDRKSTRLNSSHTDSSRMPSSA